jgi:hypothetical protein
VCKTVFFLKYLLQRRKSSEKMSVKKRDMSEI